MAAPTRQAEPTTPFAGSTFLQLQEDILALAGYTATDAPAAVLARVKRYINLGAAFAAQMAPDLCWTEKYSRLTLVADQATYVLPKGLRQLVDPMRYAEAPSDNTDYDLGEPIYPLPQEYRNRLPAETTFNQRYYMTSGVDNAGPSARAQAIVEFRPIPEAQGYVWFWYRGLDNALTSDTDILQLPEGFEGVVTHYAEFRFLRTLGEKRQAEAAKEDWKAALSMLEAFASKRRSEGETFTLPNFRDSRRPYDGFGVNPVDFPAVPDAE